MNSNSNSIGFAIVAILISIVAMFVAVSRSPSAPTDPTLGATRPSTSFEATILARGGLRLGSSANATTLQNIQMTTCNPTFSGQSLLASTTGQFFCAVSGVSAGDKVFVMLPAGAGANLQGSASTYGGFVAGSGYATTTGVVGFNITNLTGAATSSFAQATTGVQVLVIR